MRSKKDLEWIQRELQSSQDLRQAPVHGYVIPVPEEGIVERRRVQLYRKVKRQASELHFQIERNLRTNSRKEDAECRAIRTGRAIPGLYFLRRFTRKQRP